MSIHRLGNEPPVVGRRPIELPMEPPMVVSHPAVHVAPSAPNNHFPSIESRSFASANKISSIGVSEVAMPVEQQSLTTRPIDPPVVGDPTSKPRPSRWKRMVKAPFYLAVRSLDLITLLVLIAVVAAIPVLQFISLGYLLLAGGRLAEGRPWSQCLPGLRLAGKIGLFALLSALLALPVLLVADLAHSAQLLEPNSPISARWRFGAFLLTAAWLGHTGWAAMRGGRWWHLVWPAPVKFLKQFWRLSTWDKASDQLYDLVAGLQLTKLWWMGAQATVGALLWLVIPVSMMIIGLRAEAQAMVLIGLIGAILMAWVMFYLPFFQLLFAQTGSMKSFLAVGQVRKNYSYAPWAHTLALVLLSTLAIPLYLLRIEATPSELTWLPSLFFALLMLPTKLALGWAIGYSNRRQKASRNRRAWWSRIPAKLIGFTAVGFYVGALYVAQLVAAQGAYVMYFQHAFLVPNPLFFGN